MRRERPGGTAKEPALYLARIDMIEPTVTGDFRLAILLDGSYSWGTEDLRRMNKGQYPFPASPLTSMALVAVRSDALQRLLFPYR